MPWWADLVAGGLTNMTAQVISLTSPLAKWTTCQQRSQLDDESNNHIQICGRPLFDYMNRTCLMHTTWSLVTVGICQTTTWRAGTFVWTLLHVAVACLCTNCCNSLLMNGSSFRCRHGCCMKASYAISDDASIRISIASWMHCRMIMRTTIAQQPASCTPVAACSVHNAENCAGLRHFEPGLLCLITFAKNRNMPYFSVALECFCNIAKLYRHFISKCNSQDLVHKVGGHFAFITKKRVKMHLTNRWVLILPRSATWRADFAVGELTSLSAS